MSLYIYMYVYTYMCIYDDEMSQNPATQCLQHQNGWDVWFFPCKYGRRGVDLWLKIELGKIHVIPSENQQKMIL